MASTLDLSPHIRISEPSSPVSWSKFTLSFIGLVAVGVSIGVFGSEHLLDLEDGWLMSLFLSLAVLGFGASSLLLWRQKTETQEIVVSKEFVEVRSSLLRKPLFHSPVATTKLQRFTSPGGREQIFLRNEEKALEVGQNLDPEQQQKLIQHLQNLLGERAPLGFSRKTA